jgi:hypothetical protein
MGERVIEVSMAFDNRNKELWFVDAPEKLTKLLRTISLKRGMTLSNLKATVYDSERDGEHCVVDVDGWVYQTRHVQALDLDLIATAQLPTNPELPL